MAHFEQEDSTSIRLGPEHGDDNYLIIERGTPDWDPQTKVIRFRVAKSGGMAPELTDEDWTRAILAAIDKGILKVGWLMKLVR